MCDIIHSKVYLRMVSPMCLLLFLYCILSVTVVSAGQYGLFFVFLQVATKVDDAMEGTVYVLKKHFS